MNLYDEALSKALWIKFNKDIKVDEIVKALKRAKNEHELLGLYQYINATNYNPQIIVKALERAKKEHELLGLYRKHINTLCQKDREGVKNSLFSSEHLAYELYEKIKQLEEELK